MEASLLPQSLLLQFNLSFSENLSLSPRFNFFQEQSRVGKLNQTAKQQDKQVNRLLVTNICSISSNLIKLSFILRHPGTHENRQNRSIKEAQP
jgi:hypothetical protein